MASRLHRLSLAAGWKAFGVLLDPYPCNSALCGLLVVCVGLELGKCHPNPSPADDPIQPRGINYKFAVQPSNCMGNPAADMQSTGKEWGSSRAGTGLKDALQSVLLEGTGGHPRRVLN